MSVEVVLFPDIVVAARPWLQTRLTARGESAPVVHRVPSPRPARMVRLTVAGGQRLDIARRQVRLLVEAWEADEPRASRLAELCSAELEAACRRQEPLPGGVWIAGEPEDFSVPVSFPDPLTASARYQFTCTLTLTGSAI